MNTEFFNDIFEMTCDGGNCDWAKTDYKMKYGRAQFIAFYAPRSEITDSSSCNCDRDTEESKKICCQSCKSYEKTTADKRCDGCDIHRN